MNDRNHCCWSQAWDEYSDIITQCRKKKRMCSLGSRLLAKIVCISVWLGYSANFVRQYEWLLLFSYYYLYMSHIIIYIFLSFLRCSFFCGQKSCVCSPRFRFVSVISLGFWLAFDCPEILRIHWSQLNHTFFFFLLSRCCLHSCLLFYSIMLFSFLISTLVCKWK